MNERIQKAMMAMQLLKMLQEPQQQQQQFDLQQQALDQRIASDQARMQQMNQLGVLESLTNVSRDPMTGGADPSLVLDYLNRQMGIPVQRPVQPAGPMDFFKQQQTK